MSKTTKMYVLDKQKVANGQTRIWYNMENGKLVYSIDGMFGIMNQYL